MNKEIVKPMSVARHEFIDRLTAIINESNLPPFVIEPILGDFYNDIKLLAKRQYEMDLEKYNEMKK